MRHSLTLAATACALGFTVSAAHLQAAAPVTRLAPRLTASDTMPMKDTLPMPKPDTSSMPMPDTARAPRPDTAGHPMPMPSSPTNPSPTMPSPATPNPAMPPTR